MGGLAEMVALAGGQKGAALRRLVEEAVAAPGIYVFSELLQTPNIKELSLSAEGAGHARLLELFAYGDYADFVAARKELPALGPAATTKLRQLSLVSLATRRQRLPYPDLLQALGLSEVRELEDLIIDAVYKGILKGKLDQAHQCFEVEEALGRDVRPEAVAGVAALLGHWHARCEEIKASLEAEMSGAEEKRAAAAAERSRVEEEFNNLKKTLKVVGGGGGGGGGPEEEGEVSSSRDREPERKKEKAARATGRLRGSQGAAKAPPGPKPN